MSKFSLAEVEKTTVVFPSSFLINASNGLIGFGIIYYLRDTYRAEPYVIGLFVALYSVFYFSGCLLLRPLLQKLLPRISMLIGIFLMASTITGILLIHSLPVAFVLYCISGFGIAFHWPPLMGWISAGREGQALNKTIGRFNFSWSSANVASPFLAGLLFEIKPVLPLWTGVGIQTFVFLAFLAASLGLPKIRTDRYREPEATPETGTQEKDSPLRYIAWIGIFSSYAMIGVVNSMFPLFGREVLSLSASIVGGLLFLRALSTTTGFVLFGKTSRWHFLVSPHFFAQGGFILIIFSLLAFPKAAAYAVLLPIFGMVAAYSYASSIYHGAAGTTRRGRSMTIHEAVLTAGQVLGSVGSGLAYQHYGMPGALVFLAAILFLCGFVQGFIARKMKKEDKSSS